MLESFPTCPAWKSCFWRHSTIGQVTLSPVLWSCDKMNCLQLCQGCLEMLLLLCVYPFILSLDHNTGDNGTCPVLREGSIIIKELHQPRRNNPVWSQKKCFPIPFSYSMARCILYDRPNDDAYLRRTRCDVFILIGDDGPDVICFLVWNFIHEK